MTRTSLLARTLGAVAASCVASLASAGVTINSNFWLHGVAGGFDGVTSNMVMVSSRTTGTSITSAVRPSGGSSWVPNDNWLAAYGPAAWNGTTWGQPYADIAGAMAWADANSIGAWSVTESGASARTIDSTSGIVPAANRVYAELSAASASLYGSIVANGLTGTFTFNLKQAYSASSGYWLIATNDLADGFYTGSLSTGVTSFSVTITNPLQQTHLLEMGRMVQAAVGDDLFQSTGGVAYGNLSVVPGPGVVALAAMAGLVDRRRRR